IVIMDHEAGTRVHQGLFCFAIFKLYLNDFIMNTLENPGRDVFHPLIVRQQPYATRINNLA
ncbi:MAG: hypothetical protein ABJQ38_18210, partial [Flavobacteriaceae bacterium]